MKTTTLARAATTLAAVAVTVGIGAATVAPAWATDNIKPFGDQARVIDNNGNSLIGYTVTDLGPSSDPVGHDGQLYSATLTVRTFGVPADPMIGNFNARAESGEGYRALVDAPGAMGNQQVPAGTTSTGKLYFDVTGDVPNSVVLSDFLRDIIAWVPGEPQDGNRP